LSLLMKVNSSVTQLAEILEFVKKNQNVLNYNFKA